METVGDAGGDRDVETIAESDPERRGENDVETMADSDLDRRGENDKLGLKEALPLTLAEAVVDTLRRGDALTLAAAFDGEAASGVHEENMDGDAKVFDARGDREFDALNDGEPETREEPVSDGLSDVVGDACTEAEADALARKELLPLVAEADADDIAIGDPVMDRRADRLVVASGDCEFEGVSDGERDMAGDGDSDVLIELLAVQSGDAVSHALALSEALTETDADSVPVGAGENERVRETEIVADASGEKETDELCEGVREISGEDETLTLGGGEFDGMGDAVTGAEAVKVAVPLPPFADDEAVMRRGEPVRDSKEDIV